MASLLTWLRRLRGSVRTAAFERRLDAEIRHHLALEIEANLASGMSPELARQAASRSFGSVAEVKDECRDSWGMRALDALGQDVRYGVRSLRQNPGYTTAVLLTMALGIGANTAIFSVVNAVLLRPLPYTASSRLVDLNQHATHTGRDSLPFSAPEIRDYRQSSRTLESLVEYHNMQFDLLGVDDPQRINTGVVSANFFDVLGVKPLAGRTFVPGDDRPDAPAVLVFSYEYWKRAYGGDFGVVGRQFRMNDKVHTVVGVLPPMPQYPDENDAFMPTSACPFRSDPTAMNDRHARMMIAFGRLREGVTIDQARADLAAVAEHLRRTFPDVYPKTGDYGVRASLLQDDVTEHARPTFLILLGTAALVLLIVCANVANLSLARQLRRQREMAVRAALGASRGRLLRQMVTESTILSLGGGAIGWLIAWGALNSLVEFAARLTPRAREVSLDARVLGFSLGVSLLTGIICGSIAALASQRSLTTPLNSRQRLRSALVIAQVGVSFTLLAGAGLMLRSFYNLTHVDPGFRPEQVLSMLIQLNFTRYGRNAEAQVDAFHHALLERVTSNPAVMSAALASMVPLNGSLPVTGNFQIEGRAQAQNERQPKYDLRVVTPEYFQTLGIPLERGRMFTDRDGPDAPPVILINHAMANHYWPGEDPVGCRVSPDGGKNWRTIVGVVGNVTQYGMDKAPADEYYRAMDQEHVRKTNLVVRTRDDPETLVRQAVRDVHAIDPDQPVAEIHTLEELRRSSVAPARLTSMLLGSFALLALIITMAGITGVMTLSVSQRFKEIGIRMALGATDGSVRRMVLQQGLVLVGLGLGLGLLVSLAGTRVMARLLFGVTPTDPSTIAGVALLLLGAAAAACHVPACRATTIDPLTALRTE